VKVRRDEIGFVQASLLRLRFRVFVQSHRSSRSFEGDGS
jgi:hypothetical protein